LDGYYGETGHGERNPTYNTLTITNSTAWKSIAQYGHTATVTAINELRNAATVKCIFDGQYPVTDCNPSKTKQPCLFNIVADPCEMHNLANIKETTLRQMYHTLVHQKQSLVPQINKPRDYDGANPAKFNYTWTSWQD
jgi:hypothetical protein